MLQRNRTKAKEIRIARTHSDENVCAYKSGECTERGIFTKFAWLFAYYAVQSRSVNVGGATVGATTAHIHTKPYASVLDRGSSLKTIRDDINNKLANRNGHATNATIYMRACESEQSFVRNRRP